MSSAQFSNGSSRPLAKIAQCDIDRSGHLAFRGIDDRLVTHLPELVANVVQAADQALTSRLASDSSHDDEDQRFESLYADIRAHLEQTGNTLHAKRRIPNAALDGAIAEAVARCRNDALVPNEAKVQRDRLLPIYQGEYARYYLGAAMHLSTAMSRRLDSVIPTVDREIAILTEPVVRTLIETSRLGKASGAKSIEELRDWIPAEFPTLRDAVSQYCESRVYGHKAILEKVRKPLEDLRADRRIARMPRWLVRAIKSGAEVQALRPEARIHLTRDGNRIKKMARRLRHWTRQTSESIRLRVVRLPGLRRHLTAPLHPASAIATHLLHLQHQTAGAMEQALQKGLPNVHDQLAAGVWELLRQLLETGERELKALYRQNATVIWGSELATFEQRVKVQSDWQAAVTRIKDAANVITVARQAA